MNHPPAIALTPGEPAGIGPDLAVLLAQQELPCRLAVFGDGAVLAERARALGLGLSVVPWRGQQHRAGELAVAPVEVARPVVPGRLDVENVAYVLATLDQAVDGCLAGRFAAMVTGPVHKEIINAAGHAFTGHTEYLAARTGAARPVMLLAAESLRVALVTTHVPLGQVPGLITRERVADVLRILHCDLTDKLGLARPRIGVLGLNPHAGEGGYLGLEDRDVIAPVVASMRQAGAAVEGPLAADTAFVPAQLARFDALLAMYHDQGLPVLKHLGFGNAVNITLGLPVIRTSVDHGTALHLAAGGAVNPGSLRAAMDAAVAMGRRWQRRRAEPC